MKTPKAGRLCRGCRTPLIDRRSSFKAAWSIWTDVSPDFKPAEFVSHKNIDLQDMAQAADAVGRRDNPAFLQHWNDRNVDQRRALSAMASVPETIRIGRTIADVDRLLRDLDMVVPRQSLVQALETLADEEFLSREDEQYDFRVPLFRRWIAEKQKPEIVRELMRAAVS